jgi:hypothetical protein
MRTLTCLALLAALASSPAALAADPPRPAAGNRLFEMRTYHTHPGRLDALNRRFREHTNRIFVKHGMELVGYWTPVDRPDTLVYILAYPSKEAREASWKAFQADPDWQAAREASEKDGKIVARVESVFMEPTDYSPIK